MVTQKRRRTRRLLLGFDCGDSGRAVNRSFEANEQTKEAFNRFTGVVERCHFKSSSFRRWSISIILFNFFWWDFPKMILLLP